MFVVGVWLPSSGQRCMGWGRCEGHQSLGLRCPFAPKLVFDGLRGIPRLFPVTQDLRLDLVQENAWFCFVWCFSAALVNLWILGSFLLANLPIHCSFPFYFSPVWLALCLAPTFVETTKKRKPIVGFRFPWFEV